MFVNMYTNISVYLFCEKQSQGNFEMHIFW